MTVPTQQKAAIVPSAKAPIVVQDRPVPQPKEGEVLIKITATAINPVDHKTHDYDLPFIGGVYPAVLGSDAAGEIAALGAGVTNFQQGDRVFFQGMLGKYDYSTFQQYALMPADLVARTPKNVTDDEAAGISLAGVAAITGLYHETGAHITPGPWDQAGQSAGKGQAIVVLGGSSSVGQYVIQLAKLSGFEKIVTSSSLQHEQHLKQLGATTVLDRSSASPEEYVTAAQGTKLTTVYDAISLPETQKLGVQILQMLRGVTEALQVVTVLPPDEGAVKLGQSTQPNAAIKGVMGLGSAPSHRPIAVPFFKALGGEQGWLATGKFHANRPVVVPNGLAGLQDALNKNKEGISGQKVVIRPQETN